MDLVDNEVKIYYKHKDGVSDAWDSAFYKAISTSGLKWWVNSYNSESGIRFLSFRPPPKKVKKTKYGESIYGKN